ncbi:MAG: glycosyltransferase family 4 protein [Gemmatimonadetes bacterium]|nr:glycosyltransferase family 4 protein [Gemmatimonadota bacterium]
MRILVTTEHRFVRTPDGATWTQTMFSRRYWDTYLTSFEEVWVAGRCLEVERPTDGWLRVDGGPVRVVPVPYYVGPAAFVPAAPAVYRTLAGAVAQVDGAVIKAPSLLGSVVERLEKRRGRPFAVEVVSDPVDAFAPGAVRHPLRAFFRRWFARELRRQCSKAAVAAYVTESALQRRYPPGAGIVASHFSDVELPPAAFADAPRRVVDRDGPFQLIAVASLSRRYKGIDVAIEAVRRCSDRGLPLEFTVVGGGRLQAEYEELAGRLGVADRVRFLGQVTQGPPVRTLLDQADLFLMPSRTEGLPRALIEAMARALPCIGSAVGGIPELLHADDLVPPSDAGALARAIAQVAQEPERRVAMAARNLNKAQDYSQAHMRQRAEAFYRAFRSVLDAS